MESMLKLLILGGTVVLCMYFAYLGQRSKERAEVAKSGGGGGDGPSRDDFEALQQQVGELAERVDFAERMLAQQRERARINAPGNEA